MQDDFDRENEGDFIGSASHATAESVATLLRHCTGLVCVPLTRWRAADLDLPLMVPNNEDPYRTAFTVSVDHRSTSTGISATDRAATIRALADASARPTDFSRPGHVFPLLARPGGVLERSGHTEAGVDLVQLALRPAGGHWRDSPPPSVAYLCEVCDHETFEMSRLPELCDLSATLKLPLISISDLRRYRMRREYLLVPVSASRSARAATGTTAEVEVEEVPHVTRAVAVLSERDQHCSCAADSRVDDAESGGCNWIFAAERVGSFVGMTGLNAGGPVTRYDAMLISCASTGSHSTGPQANSVITRDEMRRVTATIRPDLHLAEPHGSSESGSRAQPPLLVTISVVGSAESASASAAAEIAARRTMAALHDSVRQQQQLGRDAPAAAATGSPPPCPWALLILVSSAADVGVDASKGAPRGEARAAAAPGPVSSRGAPSSASASPPSAYDRYYRQPHLQPCETFDEVAIAKVQSNSLAQLHSACVVDGVVAVDDISTGSAARCPTSLYAEQHFSALTTAELAQVIRGVVGEYAVPSVHSTLAAPDAMWRETATPMTSQWLSATLFPRDPPADADEAQLLATGAPWPLVRLAVLPPPADGQCDRSDICSADAAVPLLWEFGVAVHSWTYL